MLLKKNTKNELKKTNRSLEHEPENLTKINTKIQTHTLKKINTKTHLKTHTLTHRHMHKKLSRPFKCHNKHKPHCPYSEQTSPAPICISVFNTTTKY